MVITFLQHHRIGNAHIGQRHAALYPVVLRQGADRLAARRGHGKQRGREWRDKHNLFEEGEALLTIRESIHA